MASGELNGSLENKNDELRSFKYKHPISWYEGQVFQSNAWTDIEAIDVGIERVITDEQRHMWNFLRIHTSSFAGARNVGRSQLFLVKDKVTNKYLGILSLGSDVFACAPRDHAVGWERHHCRSKSVHVLNIHTCVGLQPISFNFNVGKLITMLCYTNEMMELLHEVYKEKVALITTFGLNGRSHQYDNLKCLRYVGLTQGFGAPHIPNTLIERACVLLKKHGMPIDEYTKRTNKVGKLWVIANMFNVSQTQLTNHGMKRGIYMGYTGHNAQAFLCGKVDDFEYTLPSLKDVVHKWKYRMAFYRREYLVKEERLKCGIVEWTTAPIFKVTKLTKRKKIEPAPKPIAPQEAKIQRTVEHRANMALSQMKAKRSITDDTIDSVRAAFLLKRTNKSVEVEFNLSREIVSKIKRGQLVKICEMEDEQFAAEHVVAKSVAKSSCSRAHRQLTSMQVLQMLQHVRNNPMGPQEVCDKAREYKIDISQEQAKNILKGRTRLGEYEFPIGSVTYEKYTNLLEEVGKLNFRALAAQYRSVRTKVVEK